MFLSSTETVVELIVVVVPFTVKSPVTVRLFPTDKLFVIVTSSGKPIVIAAVSPPEPDTVTSFAVPATVEI